MLFCFDRDCRNETYLSYIVGALNNFSMHFAADNHGQLCILGEDLVPLLLPLWNRTSKVVKVCFYFAFLYLSSFCSIICSVYSKICL